MPTATHSRTTTDTLRVAVIGLGVGTQHVEGFRRHPACTVAVLCDRDPATHAGREVPVVTDADDVLADPSIDVVSIASHDDDHGGQVLAALTAGKHVFVEKPLCTSIDDARRIRAALQQRPELVLSSNLILRRSPRFIRVRAMIAAGELGEIFHLQGDYHYGRLHKLTEGWRGRQRDYSVVLGGGVHVVDLLQWLTGSRVREVAAAGNGIASGSSFDGDDCVSALLRFESGVTGLVTANFGCVRPHGHGLTVHGTRATFVNDDPHGRLYRSRDADVGFEPVTETHPGAAKGDLIESFIGAVTGTATAEVTADDVFRTMAVCFAIDRARRDGAVVPVEEI